MTTPKITYSTATDAQVLENYETGCQIEVEMYDKGQDVPEIVTSTLNAWMEEGMKRGIL